MILIIIILLYYNNNNTIIIILILFIIIIIILILFIIIIIIICGQWFTLAVDSIHLVLYKVLDIIIYGFTKERTISFHFHNSMLNFPNQLITSST